ncbi:MAG: hypothetical protein V1783_04340 [Bacteroidota bacterium]
MKNTDLRNEFTTETQKRFNVEWIAYNDYAEWLEQKLVKLLTIPPVINLVCDTEINKRDSQGFLADNYLDSRV